MRDIVVREPSLEGQSALPVGHRLPSDTQIGLFDPLAHLGEFEAHFPKEMALFRAVGIHPAEAATIIDPYTGELARENFQNIGEHCIAVGYCAYKIADALCRAGLIDAADRDWITSRALVHDLTKPYEIMRRDAKRTGLAEEVYSVPAYEKLRPLLLSIGVAEDVAEYLMQAGKETGHNSLRDFIVCGSDGFTGLVKGRLAEKVVHLADDMTFTSIPTDGNKAMTEFLTCEERMLASQFSQRYPFLWTEGLGQSVTGEILALKNIATVEPGIRIVGAYADLQVLVANSIAREIQLLLDPSSENRPEDFVKNLVNARE